MLLILYASCTLYQVIKQPEIIFFIQVWFQRYLQLHNIVHPQPGHVRSPLLLIQFTPLCYSILAAKVAIWKHHVLHVCCLPLHQCICRLDVTGIHCGQPLCWPHMEQEGKSVPNRKEWGHHHHPYLGLRHWTKLPGFYWGKNKHILLLGRPYSHYFLSIKTKQFGMCQCTQ